MNMCMVKNKNRSNQLSIDSKCELDRKVRGIYRRVANNYKKQRNLMWENKPELGK